MGSSTETMTMATSTVIRIVSAGTSAAEAGLKRGDVILLWNDKPLDDTPTLMERLRDHAGLSKDLQEVVTKALA